MLLIAVLVVRRAELAEFRAYEQAAARIMRRHGGDLERTFVLDDEPTTETLRELHVVRFPDEASFAAYRADAELAALQSQRERAVVSTTLWQAEDGPRY